MFAFLKGTVHSKDVTGGPVDRLVLDVSGVGFEIWMASRTLLAIGEVGEEVMVHTSLAVRENDMTVFGFAALEERKMFQLLQTVSGVGPRLALAIVGTFSVRQFAEGVKAEDKKLISQAPGVGQKVAQRIVLELKSKVDDLLASEGGVVSGEGASGVSGNTHAEVRDILEGLGYTVTEINMAIKEAQAQSDHKEDIEELVRSCLKILGSVSVK